MASEARGVFHGYQPWAFVGIGMLLAVVINVIDLWLKKRFPFQGSCFSGCYRNLFTIGTGCTHIHKRNNFCPGEKKIKITFG